MQTVVIRLKAAIWSAVRLLRAHPQAADTIVAAAMLAVSLLWLSRCPYRDPYPYPYEPGHPKPAYALANALANAPANAPANALAYALTIASCAALALRRRRPLPALSASCAMIALYTGLDYPPTTIAWGPLFIFYTLATREPPPRVIPGALMVFVVWLQYSLKLVVPGAFGLPNLLGLLLAALQTMLVITITWVFANQTRRVAERTEQLRKEQAARAREAVANERIRIARELHDVVAHHMSVISVQTGLARYVLQSDPTTAAQSLSTIGDATREAMREMRRMLAVLRPVQEDGATDAPSRPSIEPSPGLARLPNLLERVRAAGVDVEMTVTGSPFLLPPGADLCCYRVAQESLTNVLKHAPGANALVELIYQHHDVVVRIIDDGGRVRSLTEGADTVPTPLEPAAAGSGNGLVGIRERARIYGGTLQAGPRAAGGFEVILTLPRNQDPDPGTPGPWS